MKDRGLLLCLRAGLPRAVRPFADVRQRALPMLASSPSAHRRTSIASPTADLGPTDDACVLHQEFPEDGVAKPVTPLTIAARADARKTLLLIRP